MNISTLSIKRPVLAIVMSIIIVLTGVVGYLFLGVRQFPDVDPPNITVTSTYTGANADVIESQITEPLEESINGIDGIKSLTSTSSDGRSAITVEFELGEDLEKAANDVRDRVSRAVNKLPLDADLPIVAKADANSNAILVMTVDSPNRNLVDLTEIAVNQFKERLQTIPGVGAIQVWGERKFAMRIVMDPNKLSAYGLSPSDVRTAIQRENVELPAGKLEGRSTELSIRTVGRLSTPEEFEDLILRAGTTDATATAGGGIVRLRDVARVYLGAENERTMLKKNGVPMVGLAVSPLPGANQVDIATIFYQRLAALKASAPKDIKLDVAFDNTKFIRKAVSEVEETLLIAFGLVVLIIFLFLRTWRATVIPVVAIPVSLISTFFFMWIAGFSINVLTLLGIVLATGLVVDDAIVVMENIFSKIEEGMSPREAGEKGSTEIYFAIISTTITLSVVFIPIIFMPGLTGRLFREFGLVVAMSVLISAFVSLTLTPMMSTRLLRHVETQSWLTRVTEPFFQWMNRVYERGVTKATNKPTTALLAFVVSGLLIVVVGRQLKQELAPLEDRSAMSVNVTAPEGYTFNRMSDFLDTLNVAVARLAPERKALITVTSPTFFSGANNTGAGRLLLVDPEERKRSQMEITAMLTQKLRSLSEARTILAQEQTISTGARAALPVQYVIQANDLQDLRSVLPRFMDLAQKSPVFNIVDVNLKFTKPELDISIDRARAREVGVSVMDIGDVLQAGFAGQRYGYFIRDGKQYQVIGEIERTGRSTPDDLRMIMVKTNNGSMLPIADLVSLRELAAPPALYRYNRYVSATISAGLAPGKTIADGIAVMDGIKQQLLDERFSTALTGPSRDYADSSSSLLYAFALALVFVYLILAAQFESFVDPLTIMLTVPLALAGGVLSLWLTNQTLNIFSEIGAIVLIGLVTKNGILIVEFANQRREAGVAWHTAVVEAATARFRPILMTSLATILGALPIALSLGASSESRIGMGVVVVGGMILATALTLFVIPSVYVLLSRLKRSGSGIHATTAAVVVLMFVTGMTTATAQTTLTLDDAVGIALRNNYNIQIATKDSAVARASAKQGTSGFLPTLGIAAAGTRGANDIYQRTLSGAVTDRSGAGFTNVAANATLTWTLFDGLKMFATNDKLKEFERSGMEMARSKVAGSIADVTTAYYAVVANSYVLATNRRGQELVDQRYVIEKNRHDVGSGSGVELAQAEVDRNSVRLQVVRSEVDVANAKNTLNRLLARPVDQAFDVDTVMSLPTIPPLDTLQRDVATMNPELIAAQRDMAAASFHVKEVDAAFYPRISAVGGYQYVNNQADAGFILQNRTNGWTAGLQLSMNLFNGLYDAAESEKARLDQERQQLQVRDVSLDLQTRLVQAYRRYEQGRAMLTIERESYAAAQRNATIAVEKLRLGSITSLEVRQTQQSLLEIGAQLARLQYEIAVAATEILRLSGRIVR